MVMARGIKKAKKKEKKRQESSTASERGLPMTSKMASAALYTGRGEKGGAEKRQMEKVPHPRDMRRAEKKEKKASSLSTTGEGALEIQS